jgi:hypothetical protein
MTKENEKCNICQGIGWVCENHTDKPWDETIDGGCQCGAGQPCECNKSIPPWYFGIPQGDA